MHEFSTTVQIVDKVLDEARKHKAKKVLQVNLIIGKLTFLGIEQIRFAYKILTKDTILEDSKLRIEEKEPAVKCSKCSYYGDIKQEEDPAFHIMFPTLRCPKCGEEVKIVGGRECEVKSIRIAGEK